jgi:hypothetical protein
MGDHVLKQLETSMCLSLEQTASCLVILLCCEILSRIAMEIARAALNMLQQTIAGYSVYRGKELLYFVMSRFHTMGLAKENIFHD